MATPLDLSQNQKVKLILRRLSQAYLERHQFQEAYEKLQQLYSMEPDDPEVIRDLAVACIGRKDVTAAAMAIYQRALELFPENQPLKMAMALHLARHQVQADWVVSLCENVLPLSPPGEAHIRSYLRDHYRQQGAEKEAETQELALVLLENDSHKLNAFLQEKWLSARFDEALQLLQTMERQNGKLAEAQLLTALTHAYHALHKKRDVQAQETLQLLQSARESLMPGRSLEEFGRFALLHVAAPPHEVKKEEPRDLEEYELILQDLSLDEIFDALQGREHPRQEHSESASLSGRIFSALTPVFDRAANGTLDFALFRAFFLIHLPPGQPQEAAEKVKELFASRLSQLKKAALYRTDDGFVGFAAEPGAIFENLDATMKKLSEINSALSASDRVAAHLLFLASKKGAKNEKQFCTKFVTLTHLWSALRREGLLQDGANAVFLRSDDPELQNHPQLQRALPVGPVRYLPGKECELLQIVWENPLEEVEKSGGFRIHHFLVQQNLRTHAEYATFLGSNTQLDRSVVLKIIPPSHAVPILKDPQRREEIFERLRTIARINSPHLATIFDLGDTQNMIYVIREYVEGRPITDRSSDDAQNDEEVLNHLRGLLRGLQAAAREGIFHFNLKPSNIWVTEAGEIKLTDFYCPGLSDDPRHTEVLFPAQWRYAAPEILSGNPGDVRSDIYAFGVLAYELLSGKHPYDTTVAIKTPKDLYKAQIDPLHQHKSTAGEIWNDFVMKAMEHEPGRRFQNWSEVDIALRQIQLFLMQSKMAEETPEQQPTEE